MSQIVETVFWRVAFCLPFLAAVFYVQSFHAELVDNATVHWQYVQTKGGKVYLAVDALSPSGIRLKNIRAGGQDVTASFKLVNYPAWFKGKDHFPAIDQFQDKLDVYLPYNHDYSVLYTNRWYTFLYQWTDPAQALPAESSLKIGYENAGTGNSYMAQPVQGARIATSVVSGEDGLRIHAEVLYPRAHVSRYYFPDALNIVTDNLKDEGRGQFSLLDAEKGDYGIFIHDTIVYAKEVLKGKVGDCAEGPCQVYRKDHPDEMPAGVGPMFAWAEFGRHLAMMLVVFYLALACFSVGQSIVRWRKMELNDGASRFAVTLLLGIMALTYVFFLLGLAGGLYWQLVLAILVVVLLVCVDPAELLGQVGRAIVGVGTQIRQSPWRVIPIVVCATVFFYHLAYCFIPATYTDGSSDVTNSYLPLLNDYILFHNFKAAVQNSTIGIGPQAVDVLRTVAKMLAGEPGVYLWSVLYLVLASAGIYSIGQRIFQIRHMSIYLAVIWLLFYKIFPVAIHLGKNHAAAVGLLLMAAGSIRYSHHPRNFWLPALFFSFLVSAYVFFAALAVVYYLFILGEDLFSPPRENKRFIWHLKSFWLFVILAAVFYVKLLFEVGICFSPGYLPATWQKFFTHVNQNNPFYQYIDNHYIRTFYAVNNLSLETAGVVQSFFSRLVGDLKFSMDYVPLLVLTPFLWKRQGAFLYTLLAATLVVVEQYVFPTNFRIKVYPVFMLIIVQCALVDWFINGLSGWVRKKVKTGWLVRPILVIIILGVVFVQVSDGKISLREHRHVVMQKKYLDRMEDDYKVGIPQWYKHYVLPTFFGGKSWYDYLKVGGADKYFDYAMLIRQYTQKDDTILIIPVRYHADTFRRMTARHALGSVIYQKKMAEVMADLETLKIGYLSSIPFTYQDYNPFYSPLLDDRNFSRYCRILFRLKDCKFYKIIYDGSNSEVYPSPLNVKGRPVVWMKGWDKDSTTIVYKDGLGRKHEIKPE